MAPTVAFCTLGCKVNQYDSQAMLERLESAGYTAAPFSAPCDVYVVNTCTVTGTGDKKSRQMIRRAAREHPGAAIVVTGCLAQRAAQELAAMPGVRLVLGTQRRGEIAELLAAALRQEEPLIAVAPLGRDTPFEALTVRGSEGRTRATLKIQEGCQNGCAYCIIPSVRGPVRSRPLPDIASEAMRLAEAGFGEIVVTGIHLASYGRDFGDSVGLLDALRAVARTPGVRRVRIGSLEPAIVTEAFARGLKELPAVCPHFTLALQSGSDTVLARMGRRYDTAGYRRAVEALRACYPDAVIASDILCGFPGETQAEFAQTRDFLREIGFARIHVFPYSPREGTRAARMPGQVPKSVREARAAELIALGAQLEAAYLSRWVGRTCEVLFEESHPLGAQGYTAEYVRVAAGGTPGRFAAVKMERVNNSILEGSLVREEKACAIR